MIVHRLLREITLGGSKNEADQEHLATSSDLCRISDRPGSLLNIKFDTHLYPMIVLATNQPEVLNAFVF